MKLTGLLGVVTLVAVVTPVAAQEVSPAAFGARVTAEPLQRAACDSSFTKGIMAAQVGHSTSGWRAAGFTSGLLFSIVGVAGVTVVASATGDTPDTMPVVSAPRCYTDGYEVTTRKRNRSSAFKSALVGAVVLPFVFIVRQTTR